MSLSKDAVMEALRSVEPRRGVDLVSGGHVEWVAACDTVASVKLHLEGVDAAELPGIAAAAQRAVAAKAGEMGSGLSSFIVEFVDKGGKVVHAERFGGQKSAGGGAGGASGAASASGAVKSAAAGGAGEPQPQQQTEQTSGSQAAPGHRPIPGLKGDASSDNPLRDVRHIIAVGAGKGGVGKSTVSLNIAVGLARRGHAVGILDADIYGPSMPTMLGLSALEPLVHRGLLQPFTVHGVKAMTMGKLVEADKPLIWRGPMAHGAFTQLTERTEWGHLDYLIIDLPPGTGDVPLSMAQQLKVAGAVIVCTPQKVAQDDAVRAAKMFQQLSIDILGVVENMSYFVGDDGKVYDIFGRGGAEMMAQRLAVPYLGAIPITMALRANSDSGDPTANFTGKDDAGKRLKASLEEMITNLENQVALAGMRQGTTRPSLTIS